MQTLFIDFDGTICHDRFWRSLSKDTYIKIQDLLFSGKNQIVIDWMKGVYTSEEINKIIARETDIEYDSLWNAFVADCQTMQVEPKILTRINNLRNSFHIVLITGNMDCFSRFTVPSLRLDEYFDVIVNSFDEKQLKSENGGSSFTKHVQGNISNAILIEDSENSCKVFESLGGTACRVVSPSDTLKHLGMIQNTQVLTPVP